MAQKNAAKDALDAIDKTIAEVRAAVENGESRLRGLNDARILLVAAMHDESDPVDAAPKARKTRGPNKKRGLAGGTLRQMGTADLSDDAEPNGNELENYAKPGRGAV